MDKERIDDRIIEYRNHLNAMLDMMFLAVSAPYVKAVRSETDGGVDDTPESAPYTSEEIEDIRIQEQGKVKEAV